MPPKGKGKAVTSDAAGAGYFSIYGAASINTGVFSSYLDNHIPANSAPLVACMPINPLTEKLQARNAAEKAALAVHQLTYQDPNAANEVAAQTTAKPPLAGKATAVAKAAKSGRLDDLAATLKQQAPPQKQEHPHRSAVMAMAAPEAKIDAHQVPLSGSLFHLRAENRQMDCIRVGSGDTAALVTAGGGTYDVIGDSRVLQRVVVEQECAQQQSNQITVNSGAASRNISRGVVEVDTAGGGSILATAKLPIIQPGDGFPLANDNNGCVIINPASDYPYQIIPPTAAPTHVGTASCSDLLGSVTGDLRGLEDGGLSRLLVTAGWSAARVALGQESHYQPEVIAVGSSHQTDATMDPLGASQRLSPTTSRPVTSHEPPRPHSTGKGGGKGSAADPLAATGKGGAAGMGDALPPAQSQFGRFTGVASSFRSYNYDRNLHSGGGDAGKQQALLDQNSSTNVGGTLASWPTLAVCGQEAASSHITNAASAHVVHSIATSNSRTFTLYITHPRDPCNSGNDGAELHALGMLEGESEALSIPLRNQKHLQETPRLFRQLIAKSNPFRSVLTGSAPSKALHTPNKHSNDETDGESGEGGGESPRGEVFQQESSVIGVAVGSSHCVVLVYDRPTRQTYCFGRGVMSNCGGALGHPTGERSAISTGSSSSTSMVPSPPRHPSADSNLHVSAVIKGRSKLFVNRPGVPSSGSVGGGSSGQLTEASFRSRNANTSFWGASIGAGAASSSAPLLSFMEFSPIDSLCNKGVYAIFASKQVTFAATREGLFALGTIELLGPQKHLFTTPKLVLSLPADGCIVNVTVSDTHALALLDSGDLYGFDPASEAFSRIDVDTNAATQQRAPDAVTAAGVAIQAALTNQSLSSILMRARKAVDITSSGVEGGEGTKMGMALTNQNSGDSFLTSNVRQGGGCAPPPVHEFHVYPDVPLLEEFYTHPAANAPPISSASLQTPDGVAAAGVDPMGLAVKIMLSVDDDSDGTHISGCGYCLPTAVPPSTNTGGASTMGNMGASTLSPVTTSLTPASAGGNQNQPAATPQLFSVMIAGGGSVDGVGMYGEGTDLGGLEDGAGGDIDLDDAENDADNRSDYSDENSAFSEMASTQAGGASPLGSPIPNDEYNTATSDTSGLDTRTGDSSTPSPSRKAGSLRQQQQKDFAVQQQQHLVELRTLQQSHQQDRRKSTAAPPSSDSDDKKHLFLVKGGRQHFVAQTRERGLLFGWGGNDFGQLGAGNDRSNPSSSLFASPMALSPLSLPYDAIAAAALQKYHKLHLVPSLLASLQLLHDNAVSRSYSAIRSIAPNTTTPMQFHMKLKQLLQGIPTGEFTISDPTPSAHLPYLLVSVLLAISPSDVAIEGFVCLPWSTVVTVSLRVKETRRVSYVEHASTAQLAAAAERSAAAAAAAHAAVPKKKGAKAPAPPPVAGPVGGAKKASIAPPSLVTETTATSTKVTVTVILGNTNNTSTR